MKPAMKRIIALILSLVMFSFVVSAVSCSQEGEVFDLDFNVSLDVDLTGVTFRWGSPWPTQFYPDEGFSLVGDNMRAHYREIENELKCKIEIIAWEDGGTRVMQDIAAALPTIDLLDSHSDHGGFQLYRAGLLVAADEVPNMNGLDEKYGPLRFRQYGIYDGKVYGLYQYTWDFPPEYAGALIFNSDILKKLGLPLPYEYQENGTWTWDNYEELLFSVADASANAGYEGFVPHIGYAPFRDVYSFMFMNGCQVIEKGSDGKYRFGLDNERGIAALEYMVKLVNEGLYVKGEISDFVVNQKSAFLTTESTDATNYFQASSTVYLPSSDFVYGFMSYPVGPSGDETCVSGYVHQTRRMNWVVNYSGNDLNDTGIIIDRLFDPIDDSGGWQTSLERRVFYNQRDFDNYKYMLENINFKHDVQLGNASGKMDDVFTRVVIGRSLTPAEAFESIRDVINEAIENNVMWVFEDIVQ